MPRPAFALDRVWHNRSSKARSKEGERVFYDSSDDYEYERDPNPHKHCWHRINYRADQYQDIDPTTGEPVAGSEGEWRPLL